MKKQSLAALTRRENLRRMARLRSKLDQAAETLQAQRITVQRAADVAAAEHQRVKRLAAATNCSLPSEISKAEWCLQSVGPEGNRSHDILFATYGSRSNDSVSARLCDLRYRFFEYQDPEALGLPANLQAENGGRPTVLDIGGNIGSFSAMFAKRGYNVYMVEALSTNRALMRSTICANPDLRDSVTLLSALVSTPADASMQCKVCLDFGGDATIECPGDGNPGAPDCKSRAADAGKSKRVVETLTATTIDSLLGKHPTLGKRGGVDVLKMDVEGYEWRVLEGAERFLREVRPRYIVLEIQLNPPRGALIGATPEQVFQKIRGLGYHAYRQRFGHRRIRSYPYDEIGIYETPNFYFERKDPTPPWVGWTPPPPSHAHRKHAAKHKQHASHDRVRRLSIEH